MFRRARAPRSDVVRNQKKKAKIFTAFSSVLRVLNIRGHLARCQKLRTGDLAIINDLREIIAFLSVLIY
jgi:hypothetical protein